MPRSVPEHRFHDFVEAATAVFLEQGYRRTQVADVAARMGLSKGSVYTYVESKEALFDCVLRYADHSDRIELPKSRPVATPPPEATLEMVQARLAEEGIAGLNELTLGFATTVAGACLTYWAGLRLVARDGERRDGEA